MIENTGRGRAKAMMRLSNDAGLPRPLTYLTRKADVWKRGSNSKRN